MFSNFHISTFFTTFSSRIPQRFYTPIIHEVAVILIYGCLGSSFEQPSGSSPENEGSQSQHHLWLYGGTKVLPESSQRWIMLFEGLRQQDWNFKIGKTIGKWSNGSGFWEISDLEIKKLVNI